MRCLTLGLLTLCALVPLFAQTQARERNDTEESSTDSRVAPSSVSASTLSLCLTASEEPNGSPNEAIASSTCPSAQEGARFAIRFVNEKLTVWRQCLNLEDWPIAVVMTRRADLQPKTRGQVKWDEGRPVLFRDDFLPHSPGD